MNNNPILWADYPDPDVIRVDDTYYMISTTMHMMPGCVILRSFDLVHWEVAAHVYDTFDDTPARRLEGDGHIYAKGMWAASLRYHKGIFHICFVAYDTQKTYLFTASDINGPWTKREIEGFYHDSSLLFDDDGRIFIIYGNTEIYLTELKEDLSGPKPGGLHRVIVREDQEHFLGYEGAHFHKINGRYYAFFIHILKTGNRRRTQACFAAASLEGEFTGGEVLDDDMGYHNSGVAQGGIVDTPDGKWFAVLFQDHGAVGRVPVVVPVRWENDFPVFGIGGKVPQEPETGTTRPGYAYKPLVGSDDFSYTVGSDGKVRLKDFWQWNHIPSDGLWSVTEKPGTCRIRSGKLSRNLCHAANTLTQRTMGPECEAVVTLDGKDLKDGDYAGLCVLIGTYGLIALTREEGRYYLVMLAKNSREPSISENLIDGEPGTEYARIPVSGHKITLKAYCNFFDNTDEAEFFYGIPVEKYPAEAAWEKLGTTHKMYYKLDHFMGARFGLFLFSTKETGGTAEFSEFKYCMPAEAKTKGDHAHA